MANLKKYGYFDKKRSEFVITKPLTPRPWINYLTNSRYCSIISNNAGGYTFYRDCRSDRITRWLPDAWHFDRPGRYLYVSEIKGKKNLAWSATFQPLMIKPQFYECRHGFGYTKITTIYHEIKSEITYFVPENDDCEVWFIKLENLSNRKRNLKVYPYIEWLLGDYHEELRYRNIMNLYNRIWYDQSHEAIYAKKTAFWVGMDIRPFPYVAFMGSSLKVRNYATQKYEFLGRYNTEQTPEMIFKGKVKNKALCSGEDGIAAFMHRIDLLPKKAKEFTVIIGQTETLGEDNKLLKKYRDINHAKKALLYTREIWKKRISDNIVIDTMDEDLNIIANTWLKYQVYICNFWSRSPSYYHEGAGGRGYRDSCQDAESIVSINAELTRKKIMKLVGLIREDGTTVPGWADTTGVAKHRPNKDHPVWLVYTISSYIKETGDQAILNEQLPYLKDKWLNGWAEDRNFKGHAVYEGTGSVFEHLERNLNYTFNDTGEKGLPLIGHADWNDAIDAAGICLKGESVWLAMALVRSLKILAELSILINKPEKAEEFSRRAQIMAERINKYAWDGKWYVRGFCDSGEVYGSRSNDQGKIFINTQSWALLSGVATIERQKKLLLSVDKYLDREHGYALFYPAYSHWQSHLGRISMFAEGTKENAAIFCHAAVFMIVANCLAGRGTKAYEALIKILPNKQKDYDLYKTEPYALAEYIVGPEHPYLYGEGAFTWITGSSGWAFMAITEWILGIRRDYQGLLIDPVIPAYWKGFKVKRVFRGDTYEINVKNPRGVEKGVRQIIVDGEKIKGNLITPSGDGKIHKVEVVMG
ncbi:MAG: hypothetical protein ABH952_00685 [Candidatus Omnitrophota bacterium]